MVKHALCEFSQSCQERQPISSPKQCVLFADIHFYYDMAAAVNLLENDMAVIQEDPKYASCASLSMEAFERSCSRIGRGFPI